MGDIYLVRHGQVAFGGGNYDSLSPDGTRQAAAVGRALADRGVVPQRIQVGTMNRHSQTAQLATNAVGWTSSPQVNEGWDEFDHVAVLSALGNVDEADRSLSGPDTLRRFFGKAIPRWSSGQHDHDYKETFRQFSGRVAEALWKVGHETGTDEASVVFTSAGVIGWVVASLLAADQQHWLTLIPVGVNGGVTRVQAEGRNLRLVSYNEHAHLQPELVTFR